jgi:uncharacterized membrane protein
VAVTDGNPQACLWRNGQAILLGIPPGGNFSVATAINNQSEICGYWGHTVIGPLRAFIWRRGVITTLALPIGPNSVADDINDASQITGWMGQSDAVGCEAFIWSEGVTLNLGVVPGGITGRGVAIGRNGLISGYGRVPTKANPFRRESVQWHGTLAMNCGMLAFGDEMRARGGNDFATVGYCDRPNEIGDRGFFFQNGALHDLSDLVTGATISLAQDINDYGQIVATGRPAGGSSSTLLLSPANKPIGDISHDCQVNVDDLIGVITEWGQRNSYADANSNGVVDVDDLILVILNWT